MIRVYKYGLLAPIERADLVDAQMRAGHRYRNVLTEIERGRRAALREVDRSHSDVAALEAEAAAATAALATATAEVTAARAASRSRSETAPMRELVRERRAALKTIAVRLREARVNHRSDPRRAEIDARALDLAKSARAHCGVYWGTYLLAEDAIQAARKTPLYDGAEPNDPRYRPWLREGQVSVQLQGGLSAPLLYGDDPRIRIGPPLAPARWDHERRAWDPGKANERHRTLYLRVGSTDKGGPVFAAWPIILHRPIPSSAVIKRVTASLRYHGPRPEWTVEMTVDLPDEESIPAAGAVALDLGWRLMPEGIRVATWQATTGESGHLVVPHAITGAIDKASELRSLRDALLNDARARLCAALEPLELPGWLLRRTRRRGEAATKPQALAAIQQWRSPDRFASLAREWKQNRFDGDAVAYEDLEAWRYRDHHLYCWEAGARRSSLRRRRDLYRSFAAGLTSRFGAIVLEEMDLRKFAVRPVVAADDDARQNETARGNRHAVALSELRLSIASAASSRGARVVEVSAIDTTRACHACGIVAAWRSADHLHHACSACGAVWDQDENAAANILERWNAAEKPGTAREPESPVNPPAKRETRWNKVKRLAAEKRTTREVHRNDAK